MKVVALIPIKLNNERLPGKNTKRFFDGTPLMHLIQRVCLETNGIDETYVYCSDERVTSFLLPGIKFLKRPEYLDGNDCSSIHIISEFLREVEADVFLETHATAPFAKPSTFETCISRLVDGKNDSAFCARRLLTYLWQNDKPLNFDMAGFTRTQDLPPIHAEAPGAYLFTKEVFGRFGRRVGENPYICEISAIEAIDIDYPEDFELANMIYKEMTVRNGNG